MAREKRAKERLPSRNGLEFADPSAKKQLDKSTLWFSDWLYSRCSATG